MARQSMTKTNKAATKPPVNDETQTTNETQTTPTVDDKVKSTTTEKTKTKKAFRNDEEIECQSITTGSLHVLGPKTKRVYSWIHEDDVVAIEYQDLLALARTRSQFIFDPCFIILDDDFVEQNPKIHDLYESMYTLTDFREILELPLNDMISALNQMPKGTLNSIKNLAGTMISDGDIDSRKKTAALCEYFDTDFELLSDL